MNNKCNVPPEGWTCTREAGHEGPCAAIPDAKTVTLTTNERDLLVYLLVHYEMVKYDGINNEKMEAQMRRTKEHWTQEADALVRKLTQ